MGIVARIHALMANKRRRLFTASQEWCLRITDLQYRCVRFAAQFRQGAPAPGDVPLQVLDQLRLRKPLRLFRGYAAQREFFDPQGLAGQEPLAGGVDVGMDIDSPQIGDAGHITAGDDLPPIVPALVLAPHQHVPSSPPADASVGASATSAFWMQSRKKAFCLIPFFLR